VTTSAHVEAATPNRGRRAAPAPGRGDRRPGGPPGRAGCGAGQPPTARPAAPASRPRRTRGPDHPDGRHPVQALYGHLTSKPPAPHPGGTRRSLRTTKPNAPGSPATPNSAGPPKPPRSAAPPTRPATELAAPLPSTTSLVVDQDSRPTLIHPAPPATVRVRQGLAHDPSAQAVIAAEAGGRSWFRQARGDVRAGPEPNSGFRRRSTVREALTDDLDGGPEVGASVAIVLDGELCRGACWAAAGSAAPRRRVGRAALAAPTR
jgi:hypothetical protein